MKDCANAWQNSGRNIILSIPPKFASTFLNVRAANPERTRRIIPIRFSVSTEINYKSFPYKDSSGLRHIIVFFFVIWILLDPPIVRPHHKDPIPVVRIIDPQDRKLSFHPAEISRQMSSNILPLFLSTLGAIAELGMN